MSTCKFISNCLSSTYLSIIGLLPNDCLLYPTGYQMQEKRDRSKKERGEDAALPSPPEVYLSRVC